MTKAVGRQTALLFLFLFASWCAPQVRAQPAVYQLQPGDIVQVWVAQAEELRRDVVIGPDGSISLPFAGHMSAQGQTLLELETSIRDRLKPFYTEIDLTLMLRPARDPVIYVVGEVTTPGAYPYRPNMTVLHALSVAGGLYRAAVLPADQDRSVVVGRQIADGDQRLLSLTVRIARLQAELAGKSKLSVDGAAANDPLVAQEQMLLDARSASVHTLDAAQEQAKALNQRSRQALQEQIETVTRRIELSKDRLRSVSALIAKGGAESSQKNRHEAEIAELDGQISRLNSEMVVLDRAGLADTARYDAARQERRTELLGELQAAEREKQDTAARLSDSRRIMSIYGASSAASEQREQQVLTYTILRSEKGAPRETEATETSPLQPNDLVRVHYAPQGPEVGSSNALPSSVQAAGLRATSMQEAAQ